MARKVQYVVISVATVLLAGASQAQEVNLVGGRINLAYSEFTSDTSFAKATLDGSMELGFGQNIGLQMDLGLNAFNAANEQGTNVGLHGLYHVDQTTSLGAFYSVDTVEGTNTSLYGVEAGHSFGDGGVDGYLGQSSGDGSTATIFGLNGTVRFSDFGIGASLDYTSVENVSLTRIGIQGSCRIGDMSKIYVEVGQLHGDIDGFGLDSESYVKLGATFNLGPKHGTTFGSRSLFNLIPGL